MIRIPNRKDKDHIEMDLKETRIENVEWYLVEDRIQWPAVVKAAMNFCFPLKKLREQHFFKA